ncbi:hypothetical protein HYN86_03535 [Flavobacterium fluviale]|uniref:Uncharacterized protein n=1 Tax=Flavobacterium fluviale TaxID=2249356 RepID=A0A344LP78_9FLAO|nr:hypothetical protein HYN86_03535 [Flavobacterium fluviale]
MFFYFLPQINEDSKGFFFSLADFAHHADSNLFNHFNLWLNILFSNNMLDALQCISTNYA